MLGEIFGIGWVCLIDHSGAVGVVLVTLETAARNFRAEVRGHGTVGVLEVRPAQVDVQE